MDKEKAKEFIFHDKESHIIYISKDLQKLLDKSEGELFFIYAVLETESGETLMKMDWSYAQEPIIMSRFLHTEFFFKFYSDDKQIRL